jgi:hypothetical protein
MKQKEADDSSPADKHHKLLDSSNYGYWGDHVDAEHDSQPETPGDQDASASTQRRNTNERLRSRGHIDNI